MRPFIALSTVALVLCLATLVSAQNTGTGKSGSDPKKPATGKSSPTVTKKTDTNPGTTSTKGGYTFTAKSTKDIKSLSTKDPKITKGPPSKDPKIAKGSGTKDAKGTKGVGKPPQTTVHREYLAKSVASGSVKLDPGQRAAMDRLLAHQPLSFDDRQRLSDVLFRGRDAGLSSEDEAALSYLLTDDIARNPDASLPPDRVAAGTRPLTLRVVNKTSEKVKVWVQVIDPKPAVVAKTASDLPAAMKYEMQPGKAYDLMDHNKTLITASTIRIWAISPTQQWASNRDQDLPLSAPTGSDRFVVTFAPAATTAAPGGLGTMFLASKKGL